jgi:hypothetical protein
VTVFEKASAWKGETSDFWKALHHAMPLQTAGNEIGQEEDYLVVTSTISPPPLFPPPSPPLPNTWWQRAHISILSLVLAAATKEDRRTLDIRRGKYHKPINIKLSLTAGSKKGHGQGQVVDKVHNQQLSGTAQQKAGGTVKSSTHLRASFKSPLWQRERRELLPPLLGKRLSAEISPGSIGAAEDSFDIGQHLREMKDMKNESNAETMVGQSRPRRHQSIKVHGSVPGIIHSDAPAHVRREHEAKWSQVSGPKLTLN